jgi:hypothetical protein
MSSLAKTRSPIAWGRSTPIPARLVVKTGADMATKIVIRPLDKKETTGDSNSSGS